MTGETFEHGDGESVHISGRSDRLAAELLGCGICGRADRQGIERTVGRRGLVRDAKITEEEVAVVVDEHVGRFDVAVHDAGPVGNGQCRAHVGDHAGGLVDRQAAVGDALLERAGEQAHHQACRPRFAPVVVQRHDVRVFEVGHEVGLGFKPADELWPVGQLGTDHLDGHRTADRRLAATVDHREGSLADAFQPFPTRRDRCGRFGRRSRRCAAVAARSDGPLQRDDLVARLKAEVGGEPTAIVVKHSKCLGLAARPVQHHHEQHVRALAQPSALRSRDA